MKGLAVAGMHRPNRFRKVRPIVKFRCSAIMILAITTTPTPSALASPPANQPSPPNEIAVSHDAPASKVAPRFSTGVSGIIYLHALGHTTDWSVDLWGTLPLRRVFSVAAGVRLGLGRLLSELFLRVGINPYFKYWRPSVGLELGATRRREFPKETRFAEEVSEAIEEKMSPIYAAFHASPLRFRISKRWHFGVCDIRMGTHLFPTGRFSRFELGLVAVGYAP